MKSNATGWLIAALVGALPFAAAAQGGYPSRVVRVIVPSSAGAGGDTIARVLSQGLTERLGRQVIVDNRPGASTMIGGEAVARAAPDGHTLLFGMATLAINPSTYRRVPYDVTRDFVPITQVAVVPNLLMAHPSMPARSVKELIALARARPGQAMYASGGFGTSPHLSMELFCAMADVRMLHVPYKGGGPAIIDLIAGHVALMSPTVVAGLPHVRAGRLRGLGVTSGKRSAIAPDIPTIAEAGLPGYESVQWYGLLAPSGTPRDVVARLHKETIGVILAADNKARLSSDGADAVGSTPEEFASFLRAEIDKWAKVSKAAGITPE